MSSQLGTVCDRLAEALLNGGYQGIVIVVVVAISLKLMRRANAATKHAVLFATLLIVTELPIFHFIFPTPGGGLFKTFFWTAPAIFPAAPATIPTPEAQQLAESSEAVDPPQEYSAAQMETPETDDLIPSEASPSEPLERAPLRILDSMEKYSLPSTPVWTLPKKTVLILSGFLILALLRLGYLFAQYLEVRNLKLAATAPPKEIQAQFRSTLAEFHLRRNPTALMSKEATAPMAVGFLKPAIVMPENVAHEAPLAEIAQVLRHELAHLARGDNWANLAQQILKAIFFFNPAVLWLSRRLTIEREIACDDHVLATTTTPRAYALFLTEFACRAHSREWAVAPAAWSKKSQLKERIDMILDMKRDATPRLAPGRTGLLAALAIAIAAIALVAAPRVLLAATPKSEGGAPAAETNPAKGENEAPQATAQTPTSVTAEVTVTEEKNEEKTDPTSADQPKTKTATVIVRKGGSAYAGANVKQLTPSSVIVATPGAPSSAAIAAVPALPVTPRAPSGTVIIATSNDPEPPATPKPPKRAKRDDQSLEQRLDRLERMMEELLSKEKSSKDKQTPPQGGWHKFEFKMPDQQELHFYKEETGRTVDRAVRDAMKAAEEAQRKAMEIAQDAMSKAQLENSRKGLKQQRQALEAQRKALEKQLQSVDKQLERMQRDLDREEKRGDEEPKKEKSKETDSPKNNSVEPSPR